MSPARPANVFGHLPQVWLALEPIDMRQGIDGLSQRVQDHLGHSPCDGSAYAFCNKRGTRIKLLVWDGTGVWLAQRRLHRGRVVWPTSPVVATAATQNQSRATVCTLDQQQWQWLISGVDWQRLGATAPAHWRV